jgi:fumarate reductase subunit C
VEKQMNDRPEPRPHEPGYYKYKLHVPSRPHTWWLRNFKYFLFMMREISSAVIGLFLLLYLYEIFLLSRGPEAHGGFQELLRSPGFVLFYVVAFIFALYHSITWFGAVGKIQVVRVGAWKVPPALVTAGAFVGWIVVSAIIGVYLLGGDHV